MSLDQIKQAVKEFEAVQKKYADFGAWDSEPDMVFHYILADAWHIGTNTVSSDPEKWQLFTCSMDCTKAGKALAQAANKAVGLVLDDLEYETNHGWLATFLRDYCWRTVIR